MNKRAKPAMASAGALLVAGCGPLHLGGSGASNGSPATSVCGTVLSESVAGPLVEDATGGPLPTITDTSIGGLIYLKVATGCEHGDRVTITPPGRASIAATAKTGDGNYAAIVIRPRPGAKFHVTGTGPSTFDLTVDLAPGPLPT